VYGERLVGPKTTMPPALLVRTSSAGGVVKTAIRPRRGVIGRFARYRPNPMKGS
jgi:hypothetical protein